MSYLNKNYIATHFKHKKPIKIHEKPTYETQLKLQTQLNKNKTYKSQTTTEQTDHSIDSIKEIKSNIINLITSENKTRTETFLNTMNTAIKQNQKLKQLMHTLNNVNTNIINLQEQCNAIRNNNNNNNVPTQQPQNQQNVQQFPNNNNNNFDRGRNSNNFNRFQPVIHNLNESISNYSTPEITYTQSPSIIAKPDSGASRHYFREEDKSILNNINNEIGPAVTLPDMTTIESTQAGHLPFNHLSSSATKTQILPELQSASLISVGQLCDDGCKVEFEKEHMQVMKNNNIILHGTRNYTDGLWDINLSQHNSSLNPSSQFEQKINVIIPKSTTASDLMKYYQGSLFSPVKSILQKAARKDLLWMFPNLTLQLINKHYQNNIETAKGHLNQERQNLQSTKENSNPVQEFLLHNCFFPNDEKLTSPTYEVMAQIINFQTKEKGYTDIAGRFPHESSRGNKYIMVLYNYDTNTILAEPIPNRQAATITNAFIAMHSTLKNRGAAPKTYILDNEISGEFKYALEKNKLEYQLAPPYKHRQNAAERAIATFKEHFIAGLATAHPKFPITEWDRLIPQAILTLNLLRSSRINPKISAYASIFGNYHFNKTPIAPPGTLVLIHEKPDKRASWDPHGKVGFYIGPALEHYRCVRAWVIETQKERITDTITYFPHKIPFPEIHPQDYLKAAAKDILAVLNKKPPVVPFLNNNNELQQAIKETAKLLHRACTKPEPVPIPVIPPTPISSPPHNLQPQPKINHATLPRVKKVTFNNNLEEHIPVPRVKIEPRTTLKNRTTEGTNFKALAAESLIAQLYFKPFCNHIYNKETGKKETVDSLLNGKDKKIWNQAVSNEIGRLAQGNDAGILATDTIRFISKPEVPKNRDVTYANFTFDHRPLKSEPNRCRIVVGGDKLSYDDDASSPAASLLETKLMINSVISDAKDGARFFSADLKDFFLASPMDRPEYMKIPWKYIPDDIRLRYDLEKLLAEDGFIYVKIIKGMYGLKQAAILAYKNLVKLLAPHGYKPIKHTIGLWEHTTLKTKFCVCVDDFGIKYYSKKDADHLITTLEKYYKVSIDWEGKNYCGMTFDWHYEEGYVDAAMPGYIPKFLERIKYEGLKKPQYSPHPYREPVYGQRIQYAPDPDTSPKLDKKDTKYIQMVIGALLYYTRAIDSTFITALNELSTQQAKPTQTTLERIKQLVDYAATYPDAKLRFYASDMQLYSESDAAYLVVPNAKSRVAGYFYLSDLQKDINNIQPPKRNGPLLILCKILKNIVASAAEAETGGLFLSAQEIIYIRYLLNALGHKQQKTPLKTDNSTAESFANSNIRQKRSKAWDMRYHWLREKEAQDQIKIYWDKGSNNDADYYTKHHSAKHHREQRKKFVINSCIVRTFLRNLVKWRGCVDPVTVTSSVTESRPFHLPRQTRFSNS